MYINHIKKLIEDKIIQNGHALDLGCSTGETAQYLVSEGFSVDAVDTHNFNIPLVNFIKKDIREFSIPENTYSFIHARNILCFLRKEEIGEQIQKIQRGLAPGGFMLITLFGVDDGWNIKDSTKAFFSEAEINSLVRDFIPDARIEMVYGPDSTMDGRPKISHVFTITYRKN